MASGVEVEGELVATAVLQPNLLRSLTSVLPASIVHSTTSAPSSASERSNVAPTLAGGPQVDDAPDPPQRKVEALDVGVHQRQGGILEGRGTEHIPRQLARESRAPRNNERNLGHCGLPCARTKCAHSVRLRRPLQVEAWGAAQAPPIRGANVPHGVSGRWGRVAARKWVLTLARTSAILVLNRAKVDASPLA